MDNLDQIIAEGEAASIRIAAIERQYSNRPSAREFGDLLDLQLKWRGTELADLIDGWRRNRSPKSVEDMRHALQTLKKAADDIETTLMVWGEQE